jgi:hypothetical protein
VATTASTGALTSHSTWNYDATGRLAGRSIGDGGSAARDTIYGWDDLGRLASTVVDDGSETVATGFADRDLFGRPRSIGRYVNGSLETGESLTTDARGRITHKLQQTPTRTVQLDWGFYDDGALQSVSADWGGGTFEKLLYERSGPENELTRIAQFSTGATLSGFPDLARVELARLLLAAMSAASGAPSTG